MFATLTVLTEAATGNLYYDPTQYQQSGDIVDDSMDRKDSGIVVSDHDEQEPNDHDYEHEGHDQFSDKNFDESATMQKTKPEPCDNELYLYSLIHYTTKNESVSGYNKTMGNCSRYFSDGLKDVF